MTGTGKWSLEAGTLNIPLKPHHRTVAAIVAIVVLTVAAFLPVLRAEFLLYDDQQYVLENPDVLRGLNLPGIGLALKSRHPVVTLSHLLDISLFGLQPGGHHLTNVILHAVTAALLFLLLKGLTGAYWSSLVGAAVFAVHPLRVESVAWIAERKDVLSGVFWMLALLVYVRYARGPGVGRFLAVTTLFVLGLMAKPMLVIFPFALLLLDWWPLGRLRGAPPFPSVGRATGTLRVLLEKAALLLPALVASVITYRALQEETTRGIRNSFTLAQRIGNAVASYCSYLGKTFWPLDLYPFYPHRGMSLSIAEVTFSLGLLAALTAAALLLHRRRPWLLAGWFWYLGTLVPVIGLVQFGEPGMADRYTYLPSIGLLIAIIGEARSSLVQGPWRMRLAGASVVILLTVLTFLTREQTKHWKDTASFASRMLAGDPDNAKALNLLGAASYQRGDSAQAVVLLTRAAELRPTYFIIRFNLGLALADRGLSDEAIQQFAAAIRIKPDDAESLANRGRLLMAKGLAEPALRDLDAALAVSPAQPQILLLRGIALAQLGRYPDAAATLLETTARAPGNAEAHYHLGRVYDGMGRPAEAIASYGAALRLHPGYAEAHNNLGVTLVELGRVPEALPHFREAVRLSPSNAEAQLNLEEALRTLELPATSP